MTTTNGNGYSFENDGGDGIFVGPATIVEARSVSNEDVYKNGKPVDVGIEFTLEVGQSFQPKFTLAGNFKMEGGKITGPGSTMRVKIALNRLKVSWSKINDDNSIPQEILDQCVGKEILRLQYPYKWNEEKNKAQYATFSDFFLTSYKDARSKLMEKYENAVANGWVKPVEGPPTEEGATTTATTEAPAPF